MDTTLSLVWRSGLNLVVMHLSAKHLLTEVEVTVQWGSLPDIVLAKWSPWRPSAPGGLRIMSHATGWASTPRLPFGVIPTKRCMNWSVHKNTTDGRTFSEELTYSLPNLQKGWETISVQRRLDTGQVYAMCDFWLEMFTGKGILGWTGKTSVGFKD